MHTDKRLILAAASVATLSAAEADAKTTLENVGNKRPNVIFILLDDAGYGDFGCYGQTKIETPNIDALAEQGVRFTNMYAGAPVSAPSRCTLMTGLHSGHAQIRSNDEMTERGNVWSLRAMCADPELEGQAPLAPGTPTLGTMMRDAGYRTGIIGKWGLGGASSASTPLDMGFDYFYGYLCQRMAQCYYPPYYYHNREREYTNNPPLELGDKLDAGADPYDRASYAKFKGESYSPDAIYDKVEQFIDRKSRDPFFLMWTTTIPHSALSAPDEWVDYYVKKFGDEKPVCTGKGYFPVRYPRATYAAMISYLDHQIGELVKHLKKKGLYDNTVIMITSDNGPSHNSYTSTSWFDCAAPFRSDRGYTKRSLHEGGIRMPFIVSWGKHLRPAVSDYVGYFPDVMPTLAHLAGVAADHQPQSDGNSFVPTLLGEPQSQDNHPYLYWEFPKFKGGNGWLCVRMGQWKGLVEDVADGCTKMQLYLIEDDPREEHDVAAEHPDIVRDMWQAIYNEHTPIDHPLFRLDIRYPEWFKPVKSIE